MVIYMIKKDNLSDCNIIHYDLVEKAIREMPKEEEVFKMSEFFKIIGDPTRSKIILALLNNELCVCDIANILNMSKSSISHQLSKLKEFGVLKSRREGRVVYYLLDDEHVRRIVELTSEHIKHRM